MVFVVVLECLRPRCSVHHISYTYLSYLYPALMYVGMCMSDGGEDNSIVEETHDTI